MWWLLDWVTWGWPFHATVMYVYYSTKVSSSAGLNPFLLLHRLGVGFLGPRSHRDRTLRALRRVEAAGTSVVAATSS